MTRTRLKQAGFTDKQSKFIQKYFEKRISPDGQHIIDKVKYLVPLYFHQNPSKIFGKGRKEEYCFLRQLSHYIIRKNTDLSLRQIGEDTGNFNHATVLHSVKSIQDYIDTDMTHRIYRQFKVESFVKIIEQKL